MYRNSFKFMTTWANDSRDWLAISLVPVLLGEGRRLFEHLGAEHIELEPTRVVEAPDVTHLHYRVAR